MARRAQLTTPDLVVLSLLAEQPMHGYQLVTELERREVSDWAAISRPQVYYSLAKLARARLIERTHPDEPSAGPERTTYRLGRTARRALADRLTDVAWATQRPPNPFVTWMVLSLHADAATVDSMLGERAEFLEREIAKETATIAAIRADRGPLVPIAEAVVTLGLRQFEVELAWLRSLVRQRAKQRRDP